MMKKKVTTQDILQLLNTYHILSYEQMRVYFGVNDKYLTSLLRVMINCKDIEFCKKFNVYTAYDDDFSEQTKDLYYQCKCEVALYNKLLWTLISIRKLLPVETHYINYIEDIGETIAFTSKGEEYLIYYIPKGKEVFYSNVNKRIYEKDTPKICIVDDYNTQVPLIDIENVELWCEVDEDNSVSFK